MHYICFVLFGCTILFCYLVNPKTFVHAFWTVNLPNKSKLCMFNQKCRIYGLISIIILYFSLYYYNLNSSPSLRYSPDQESRLMCHCHLNLLFSKRNELTLRLLTNSTDNVVLLIFPHSILSNSRQVNQMLFLGTRKNWKDEWNHCLIFPFQHIYKRIHQRVYCPESPNLSQLRPRYIRTVNKNNISDKNTDIKYFYYGKVKVSIFT